MRLEFSGRRVAGLAVVLPRHEQLFDDDMKLFDFPETRSKKLKDIMGYDRHRLVLDGICSSDLAIYGISRLVEEGDLNVKLVDALIVVTQTPDYFIPPTSAVIHGAFEFRKDMMCLDITQGCAGYLIGLIQAFALMEQPSIRNILLVNTDVVSRKVSKRDRNSYPLIGDAAAITLLTKESENRIIGNVQHDGSRREALMIPAGGLRHPSDPSTAAVNAVGDNNYRALDHLVMDGAAVFNFVQREVPPMLAALLEDANKTDEDIFAYIFHQPNRFMLEKLCEKLTISPAKVPMNVVENYGNSSGVTIPIALTTNLSNTLKSRQETYCLAGFGVGLTWSSMLLDMGPLDFVKTFDDFGQA